MSISQLEAGREIRGGRCKTERLKMHLFPDFFLVLASTSHPPHTHIHSTFSLLLHALPLYFSPLHLLIPTSFALNAPTCADSFSHALFFFLPLSNSSTSSPFSPAQTSSARWRQQVTRVTRGSSVCCFTKPSRSRGSWGRWPPLEAPTSNRVSAAAFSTYVYH